MRTTKRREPASYEDRRISIGGGQNEEFPFALTTRINANEQQFLIEYEDKKR